VLCLPVKSNLKAILDKNGVSIRQVSRDIEYRFESVRQLYNDEMERYPKDLLYKLAIYLDIPINELLIIEKEEPVK